MPYLSASAVVIHYEEALYQVHAPLPLSLPLCGARACFLGSATSSSQGAGLQRPRNFLAPLSMPKRFELERRNLVHVRGEVACFRASVAPPSQGRRAPAYSNFWDLLYMRAHSLRNNNQSLHGDQTRCDGKFLHGRPRMLARNLSAVFIHFIHSFIHLFAQNHKCK